jgi:hypothetical protein
MCLCQLVAFILLGVLMLLLQILSLLTWPLRFLMKPTLQDVKTAELDASLAEKGRALVFFHSYIPGPFSWLEGAVFAAFAETAGDSAGALPPGSYGGDFGSAGIACFKCSDAPGRDDCGSATFVLYEHGKPRQERAGLTTIQDLRELTQCDHSSIASGSCRAQGASGQKPCAVGVAISNAKAKAWDGTARDCRGGG